MQTNPELNDLIGLDKVPEGERVLVLRKLLEEMSDVVLEVILARASSEQIKELTAAQAQSPETFQEKLFEVASTIPALVDIVQEKIEQELELLGKITNK